MHRKLWNYSVIISNLFTVHSDKFCNHDHDPLSVRIEEKRVKTKLRFRNLDEKKTLFS